MIVTSVNPVVVVVVSVVPTTVKSNTTNRGVKVSLVKHKKTS